MSCRSKNSTQRTDGDIKTLVSSKEPQYEVASTSIKSEKRWNSSAKSLYLFIYLDQQPQVAYCFKP